MLDIDKVTKVAKELMNSSIDETSWGISREPNDVEKILIRFARELMFNQEKYIRLYGEIGWEPTVRDFLTNGTNGGTIQKYAKLIKEQNHAETEQTNNKDKTDSGV